MTTPATQEQGMAALCESLLPKNYGPITVFVDDSLIAALEDALIGGMLLQSSRVELQGLRVQAMCKRTLAQHGVKS